MDKYGVQTKDTEKTAKASNGGEILCPECGAVTQREGRVRRCPNCGSRPFEPRPSRRFPDEEREA